MARSKRSAEEYIILALSGATTLSLLPFAIYRLANADWAVGVLDTVAVCIAAALFMYVLRTGETLVSGRIMAAMCLSVLFITVLLKGAQQLLWVYPALTAIFFLLTPKLAVVLSFGMLGLLGTLVWDQFTFFSATQFYISAGTTVMFSFAFADRMRDQHRKLVNLATKDPLTGAFNRRAMEQKLMDMMAYQRRNQDISASLILMDLDEFKKINDQHGHALGDDILVKFVDIIQQRIRGTDALYRFGGEEFVVIADNTGLQDAVNLAEELRQATEHHPSLLQHGVTISVGTASYQRDETAFEWLGRADRAMYQAKDMGRNACCVA